MKKNGFTLVELLAVVVILSLIVLITTPVILNVINKSKIKTYQRSIDSYGRAVNKAAMEYLIDHENDRKRYIKYDDIKNYIKYEGNKVECKIQEIYEDGAVYLNECKVNNIDINYSYGTYQKEHICKAVNGTVSTELGTEYECFVDDATKYKFYVISVEGDKVNLILYTNKESNSVRWWDDQNSDNNKIGPINAMVKLYNATKDWTKIPNMNLNYTDEGNNYGKVLIKDGIATITKKNGAITAIIGTADKPMKARLPMYREISGYDGSVISRSILVKNNTSAEGFWTLSSCNDNRARVMSMAWDNCWHTGYGNNIYGRMYANRPVITVEYDNLY